MESIKFHDKGPAVADVQEKLVALGYLEDAHRDDFDEDTLKALKLFCRDEGIPEVDEVSRQVWSRLVDASFELGDRNLYLRVPFFHGNDVKILQEALSVLGFSCGTADGIFGPATEQALRSFQLNMGLPSDGIAGGFSFKVLNNLRHSWEGKSSYTPAPQIGLARVSDVLESNTICLFGLTDFARSVAARMSNLALATNPASQIVSADTLFVEPDEDTIFVQIFTNKDDTATNIPQVDYTPHETLATRLHQALSVARKGSKRLAIKLPSERWNNAGSARSAQHYAIALLDAICSALVTD